MSAPYTMISGTMSLTNLLTIGSTTHTSPTQTATKTDNVTNPISSSPISPLFQSTFALRSGTNSTTIAIVSENRSSIALNTTMSESPFSIKTRSDSVVISSSYVFSDQSDTVILNFITSTSKWSKSFLSSSVQSMISTSSSWSADNSVTNLWPSNTPEGSSLPVRPSTSSYPASTATSSSIMFSLSPFPVLTTTSNYETSIFHSSHLTQTKSSISLVSYLKSSSTTIFSNKTSPSIEFTKATQTNKSVSNTKSRTFTELTKTSLRTSINEVVVTSSIITNTKISLMEFNGMLIVSLKLSFKKNYQNLTELAYQIEIVLDEALRQSVGYVSSKILLISRGDEKSKFKCTFKIYIRKPSSETASTLKERIKKYNQTNGFGKFMLHSLETSGSNDESVTEEKLYLWAIITIAVLAFLCMLILIAFLCTVVCIDISSFMSFHKISALTMKLIGHGLSFLMQNSCCGVFFVSLTFKCNSYTLR